MPCLLLVASRLSLGLTRQCQLLLGAEENRTILLELKRRWRLFPNVSRLTTMGMYRCCPARLGHSLATVASARSRISTSPTEQCGFSALTFGAPSSDSSAVVPAQEQSTQEVTRRQGRASRPVSIFARAPVCRESCVHCKACPCDVAEGHDDHTCYDCEQLMLNPAGDPNAPWKAPRLPACELICDHCSRQKCCLRYLHDSHACYWCDRNGVTLPIRRGWGLSAANCPPYMVKESGELVKFVLY